MRFTPCFLIGLSIVLSVPCQASPDPVILYPSQGYLQNFSPKDVFQKYIQSKKYLDSRNFKLIRTQKSLVQTHATYQQMVQDVPIRFAQMTFSFASDSGKLIRIFDHSIDQIPVMQKDNKISTEQALNRAWEFLKVKGTLLDTTKITERIYFKGSDFFLVYDVYLGVSDPFGYWLVSVDAFTGKIVQVKDLRQARRPVSPISFQSRSLQGVRSFLDAQKELLERKEPPRVYSFTPGQADVFDPDPRTALGMESLHNTSDASLFKQAVVSRTMPEISFDGSFYFLKGPWVDLQDFEPPFIAPSKRSTPVWDSQRGQPAFNESMTYFHIDQNQRYLQSLGFRDEKLIQGHPIAVDAQGLSGGDNSHYIPETNRIAFGQGCVDDTEDADVILHEYGHALQFAINPEWWGKDTGAMGEGFGDYWGQSYSYLKEEGKNFYPQRVFQWDASSDCWNGRRLNVSEARYDEKRNYDAHSTLENGVVSDELWSTPLFQSMLSAQEVGISKTQVDQVILEAHFGLGADVSMRQMAESIIVTAGMLFPNSPLKEIFQKQFQSLGILLEAESRLVVKSKKITDEDGDEILSPGDRVQLLFHFENHGTLPASVKSVRLQSQSDQVLVISGESALPDIPPHKDAQILSPFVIEISKDFSCGDLLPLEIQIEFSDREERNARFLISLQSGLAQYTQGTRVLDPPLLIPDYDAHGVSDILRFSSPEKALDTEVDLNLTHSFIGDLTVVLVSSTGKRVVLHDRTGFNDNDLIGTYPRDLRPAQSLKIFKNEKLEGAWSLSATDYTQKDVGEIRSWGLRFLTGYKCHE